MSMKIQGLSPKIQPSRLLHVKRGLQMTALILGLSLPINYAIQVNNAKNDVFQKEQNVDKKDLEKQTQKDKTLGILGVILLAASAGSMRHDAIKEKLESDKK